jgi:uncharacterized membrane protein
MKTRSFHLTLAVTASLALGATTAQAMNELGGGSTSAGAKTGWSRQPAGGGVRLSAESGRRLRICRGLPGVAR